MDTPKPPQKPTHLLDDLESIREFLAGDESLEPPLLTDSIELGEIPLLSDIVSPGEPPAPPVSPTAPPPSAPIAPAPRPTTLAESVQQAVLGNRSSELLRLDNELRAAAQLILQDVIDDFVPQIEAELKRRLEARLTRLLPPRKP
ncbi:DNA polymerase III subunit chi [Pseudomonas cavernicola]|uniref:DNA polymerase III subunit chi n=1 Tax=Pseudomonas cavernicola TaxID=2320866 RepID=A0A418XCQ9_9PSED|nr:DNA polymerase III subunit chi [Pseudomonas cavernicola]RJG10306.1 DNA polymerase III subunit chi [Pseudomonas cavernicola]